MSRRRFLAGAAGVGLSAALWSPTQAIAAAARASMQFEGLPSQREVWRWLEHMARLGPRFTGTPAHNKFIDFLDEQFSALHMPVHRERQHFTPWTADRWDLELQEGARFKRVPAASYYSYSGRTGRQGVTGDLVYLGAVPPPSLSGDPLNVPATEAAVKQLSSELNEEIVRRLAALPGGVKDRVVLMDGVIPPTSFGALEADASYVYDPDGTLGPTTDFKRAPLLLATLPPLDAFREAGAAGVVFALDASAANAAGQYAPFIEPLQNIPALLVDREVGKRLRRQAADRGPVRLTLEADQADKVPTDTLWAELPGSTDEVMIVNTHTDGPNAIEENGGLASVALARHFAALPKSARRRTLIFTCVTGHFANEVKSTPGCIANNQDTVGRAAAALAVEHFGCREWRDDPVHGYRPTGLVEPALAFHSQTPILAEAIESVRKYDLRRTALLRPLAISFLGEGAPLHESGIPTIGYVPGPNYLLSFADDGHIRKLSSKRFYREILWAADLIHRLDSVPAAVLKAGDSAVLPKQLGGQIPIE